MGSSADHGPFLLFVLEFYFLSLEKISRVVQETIYFLALEKFTFFLIITLNIVYFFGIFTENHVFQTTRHAAIVC